MTSWSPKDYLRFADERTRPAADLVARIAIEAPRRVADLGCGPGNSTQVLRARWPLARVTGVDSSPEMIAAARREYPDGEWVLGGIEEWSPEEPFDVVFSNAALQWVPQHARLVSRLASQVAPGGALAFQIPGRSYAAVQSLIIEVAHDVEWVDRMHGPLTGLTMEAPDAYYDALSPTARSLDIWETSYHHVMESPEAIVEWMASTGLRPFLDRLDSDVDRQRFTTKLTQRVVATYERRSDGRVLFPFTRTFVIAYV